VFVQVLVGRGGEPEGAEKRDDENAELRPAA
jgi:hypothetical protein